MAEPKKILTKEEKFMQTFGWMKYMYPHLKQMGVPDYQMQAYAENFHHETFGDPTKAERRWKAVPKIDKNGKVVRDKKGNVVKVNVQITGKDEEKLFNIRYAGTLGNGDEKSGDGFRFRGRGFVHLTGRKNYEDMARRTGYDIVNNPDLMLNPRIGAAVSAEWLRREQERKTYNPKGVNDFSTIGKVINPGEDKLSRRSLVNERKLQWDISSFAKIVSGMDEYDRNLMSGKITPRQYDAQLDALLAEPELKRVREAIQVGPKPSAR
jgi:hypothetical protein